MTLGEYKKFKKRKSPKDIFGEHLEDFVALEGNPTFREYREIVEWRIHNSAEQLLSRPKEIDYFNGYIDGQRLILQDFKKIKKLYHDRETNKKES